MAEILTNGVIISIDDEISAPVVIGGVTGFTISGGTAADIQATNLADVAHTYLIGLPDRGDLTISLNRDLDDVGQIELFDASKDQSSRTFIVTFPSGTLTIFTFEGLVKSLTTEGANVDGIVTGTATVKISGEIAES